MTSMQTLNKQHKDYLYDQLHDFINKGYFKYLTGSKVVDGFLIFSIGNEQSIHINPELNLIVLVDDQTWHNENYETEDSVRVLVIFFTTLVKKIEDFYNQLGTDLSGRILKTLTKPALDPEKIFFETEVWYYKSLFSGHAGNYVNKITGVYAFKLADGKTLHFIAAGEYLTDRGIYFINDPSKKIYVNAFEPDCTKDLLKYLKELCKRPENLKNLARI